MNLFNFLNKPVTKIQVIRRDPFRLTPTEWRNDNSLCELARRTLTIPEVRMILDCLRNAAHGWAMNPTMPFEERAIRSAVNEGYMICLNEFEKLAEPEGKPQQEMPMPDFKPDNRFDEEEVN